MIILIAIFLLSVVFISIVRHLWWVKIFVPINIGKPVKINSWWPWYKWPFNTKLGIKIHHKISLYWHHKVMRRHRKEIIMVGNYINGIKQKKDFWFCNCGYTFSWMPENNPNE